MTPVRLLLLPLHASRALHGGGSAGTYRMRAKIRDVALSGHRSRLSLQACTLASATGVTRFVLLLPQKNEGLAPAVAPLQLRSTAAPRRYAA